MNDWNINYEKTLNYLNNLLNYLEKRYFSELTDEEKASNSYLYLTEKNILKSILNKKDAKEIEKIYYFILEITRNIQFIKLNNQLNSLNEEFNSLTKLNELLDSILNTADEEENNILDLSLD